MIGVNVGFQYEDSFDRARVIGVADNARAMFEGMPRCGDTGSVCWP